jgi:type 2A phosphatase activator TIP41
LLLAGIHLPFLFPLQALPRRDDLTPLTDPNFIAKVLTSMPREASQQDGANTGWRGLGTRLEVAVLN